MVDHITVLQKELDHNKGILRLKPNYVARDNYPGLGRLGIKRFRVGARGWICERWIASSVLADNVHKVANEGLTYIEFTGKQKKNVTMTFPEALELLPDRMLGAAYAKQHHSRFGALTKILDIGLPIAWHIHARKEDARKYWGMNPKEEAYFFLDHPNHGPLPYSHLGVHSWVTEDDVLPIMKRWNDDKALDLSPAYRLNVGEGFHLFPGIPHAPGTVLTLEIQEESDVYNMLQAFVNGMLLPKESMLRGLPDEESVMRLIDWKKASDPEFYRKYHMIPEVIGEANSAEPTERWIFNPNRSSSFSGKELTVPSGKSFVSKENGAYALFAWKGRGRIGDRTVKARHDTMDELFISHEAAMEEHLIENVGKQDLLLYKLFGPDVNRVALAYK